MMIFPGGHGHHSRSIVSLELFCLLEFGCRTTFLEDIYRALFPFVNGYAASVYRHRAQSKFTYEVTVMRQSQAGKYSKVIDTPITKDVISNLTPELLERVLQQIKALPTRPSDVELKDE